jgi:cell division protein FtsL
MKTIYMFLLAIIVGMSLACSSPQDRAYKAQEKVHKERLKLVEQYKKCLKEAGEDKVKIEACDQYLKAAEALK